MPAARHSQAGGCAGRLAAAAAALPSCHCGTPVTHFCRRQSERTVCIVGLLSVSAAECSTATCAAPSRAPASRSALFSGSALMLLS
jgi:hypothetical protein